MGFLRVSLRTTCRACPGEGGAARRCASWKFQSKDLVCVKKLIFCNSAKVKKEKEVCQLEGRSGEIMGEVLAATRDMLNLWIQLGGSMDEQVDWCSQVSQAAGRGSWAR